MENFSFFIKFLIISISFLGAESQLNQNCTNAQTDSCCEFLNKNIALPYNNPDFTLNTSQLFQKYNITFQVHYVTTNEGYILNVYRLPGNLTTTKGPIYVNHALLASADTWLIADLATGNTIPQLLLNDGWDVWIAQARGTPLSQGTTNGLDASQLLGDYWKFSWNELGSQDVPQIIDYILANTSYINCAYLGHSMGSTQYYVALSTNPTYNDKISVGILLAPPAYMSNAQGALGILARAAGPLPNILNLNGDGQIPFGLTSTVQQTLLAPLCSTFVGNYICTNAVFAISGFNLRNTNCSQIGFGVARYPSTASIRSVLHYAQEITPVVNGGRFCTWDTRPLPLPLIENPSVDYNLTNIKAKTAIFYGGQDFLADKIDVELMISALNQINNKTLVRVEYIEEYMHLDFVIGIDAKVRLHPLILETLNQYLPKRKS